MRTGLIGLRWVTGMAMLACAAPFALAQGFIAGEQPGRRPEGAPAMAEPAGGAERLATLAKGVEAPIPEGVARLNVPGRWFTPFDHPGMTGPYDLRGWHKSEKKTAPPSAAAGASAKTEGSR